MNDGDKIPFAYKLAFGFTMALALFFVILAVVMWRRSVDGIPLDVATIISNGRRGISGSGGGDFNTVPNDPVATINTKKKVTSAKELLVTALATAETAVSKRTPPPKKSIIHPIDPDYALKPDKVSALFANFADWTEVQKVNEVTAIMHSAFLPDDVLTMFKNEIQNKNNGHLLRNNMANALMSQKQLTVELEDIFWREFCNLNNSPTWRDYSLQFYAQCARFSPRPVNIRDNLLALIDAPQTGGYAATAAIMLTYEWEQHELDIPGNFAELVENGLLNAKSANLQAAGLSALGRIHAKEKLLLVREYLQSHSSLVQRTALATLGTLGDAADLPTVEAHINSTDRLVAAAARSAAVKLRSR